MSEYPAHIRREESAAPTDMQSVEEHCRKTAEYAGKALRELGLEQSAALAGLVHDAGKYTGKFRNYITLGQGTRGTINHTFAGVRLLLERYHDPDPEYLTYEDIASEILAAATGAHHGWFDCVGEDRQNGFDYRLTKADIGYEEAAGNFFRHCTGKTELDAAFKAAVAELTPVLERITDLAQENAYEEETAFYTGLLVRLVCSAVIEGDRRDTAEWMNGTVFLPYLEKAERTKQWDDTLRRVERKLEELKGDSAIDAARGSISRQCRAAGEHPGGIFRLNVPTGGGKTLSSLRFALAHAAKWGKSRIIFTAPLLSILDQNAAVIRRYVQDDGMILEHHSNLVQTEEDGETLDLRELLTETWEAPIIITTLVQLLNTLFCGKTTAVRRFHALADSIIIIDEVQSVPNELLTLFSLAVNFLADIMGATVVLCSATQPCLEETDHPLHGPITDMVPQDEALWNAFRRTQITPAGMIGPEETEAFARRVLEEWDSLLMVCNKKAEATELFHRLRDFGGNCFHLSAGMCMAHRREVLQQLLSSLAEKGGKTLCVATQVIEAGIDISFQQALRFMAGLDSVVQTAGRCNRSGEADTVMPVYLAQYRGETLGKLKSLQAGKDAAAELLAEYEKCPGAFDGRLDSEAAVRYYYRALYRQMPRGCRDAPVEGQAYTLFDLLGENGCFANEESERCEKYFLHQAFRLAGKLFTVFGEDTVDVIAPYGEGQAIIAELDSEQAGHDAGYVKALMKRARPYTVSLYGYQVKKLEQEHALRQLRGGALGLVGHYDNETGFTTEQGPMEFMEG